MHEIASVLVIPASVPLLVAGVGGTAAILGGALALGVRHGIDWDHIAAIADITSTSVVPSAGELALTREPGVQLTDESHHRLVHAPAAAAMGAAAGVSAMRSGGGQPAGGSGAGTLTVPRAARARLFDEQRPALLLGTLYAAGHGSVVIVLGLLAIVAASILPDWIDLLMERVVGVTLLFLAGYLWYSLYRFFRGGEEFHIRSRWMVVFAVVGNGYHRVMARIQPRHRHHHIDANQQYGRRTAFGIGMIHGVGAETGTQVLVIATAVGAGSKAMSVAALLAFVLGLLISNSTVTLATATGFMSARRRQWIYVAAGTVAAVFSLVVGLVFLLGATTILPPLS